MAKTAKKWRPKRIRSEEDRRSGQSGFIRLADGESFLGYALFEADPKKNDPGYYEYRMHWVPSANRSVPCADEDCPLCEEGDKPKEVANTLWLVVEDENGNKLGKKGEGELRTFRLNSLVIKQFTELRGEGEKIKGRLWRVKRVSEKGDYMLLPKSKKLSAADHKALLKVDEAPDYDQMVTSQLNKMMEGVAISRAMDDDEEDEEERVGKATAKGGKGKSKKKRGNDWPEEGDDELVTVDEVDEENFLMVASEEYDGTVKLWGTPDIDVTEFEEGDEITVGWLTDDDDDFVLTDDPEVVEAEPEDDDDDKTDADDLPDEIEDETLEVVSIDEAESTMEVKNEDIEFTLYFLDQGPASEVDFDDYKEGAKIVVSAEKDSVGDMVATAVPEVKKAKKAASKKTSSKKSSGKSKAKTSAKKSGKSSGRKKKGGKK